MSPRKPLTLVDPTPTTDAWIARFRTRAEADHTSGTAARLDPDDCVRAARSIARIGDDPSRARVAALLAAKGLDATFLRAAASLADGLQRAVLSAPPDLRTVETITPEERALIAEAGETVAAFKKSAADIALSLDNLDAVKALGRGMSVQKQSLPGVQRALRQFLDGARSRGALLAEAGIGADELAELNEYATRLDAIAASKAARHEQRDELSTSIEVGTLALESLFELYRARVRVACRKEPLVLDQAMSLLPRSPERRARTANGPAVVTATPAANANKLAPTG